MPDENEAGGWVLEFIYPKGMKVRRTPPPAIMKVCISHWRWIVEHNLRGKD